MQGDNARLIRSDGSALGGEVEGFDAATKEFLVAAGGRISRIAADSVDSISLSSSGSLSACNVRAICDNGVRVSGNWRKVEGGRLWLSHPGIAEPLAIKISSLHSLVVLQNRESPNEPIGRSGRLESDGVSLQGCLVEARQLPGASCLACARMEAPRPVR